jgi:hypothetical protein
MSYVMKAVIGGQVCHWEGGPPDKIPGVRQRPEVLNRTVNGRSVSTESSDSEDPVSGPIPLNMRSRTTDNPCKFKARAQGIGTLRSTVETKPNNDVGKIDPAGFDIHLNLSRARILQGRFVKAESTVAARLFNNDSCSGFGHYEYLR